MIKVLQLKMVKSLQITYLKDNQNAGFDEWTLATGEKPRPEFYKAGKDLYQDVFNIMEFPESKKEKFIITEIDFSYHGAAIGISFKGKYQLEKVQIFTGYKTYKIYTENPNEKNIVQAQILPVDSETTKRIQTLIEEIVRFINGERAQTDLFASSEE